MYTDQTQMEATEVMEEKLLYGSTTGEIIGAAYEVHNQLGYGFLERVYQRALQAELIARGCTADLEHPIKVQYKGVEIGDYFADLFVNGTVIVEIKVAKNYQSEDEAQLLNELKATKVKVGLLINFGREGVQYKRMVL